MIVISIDPLLGHLGPWVLGWHGIFAAAGILAAILFGRIFWRRAGLNDADLADFLILAAVCTFLGSKLFYWIGHPDTTQQGFLFSGLTFYGAIVGTALSAVLFVRHKHISFWQISDALAVALPTSQAVGRPGCLILGDIYGMPTQASWGIVYLHPGAVLPGDWLGQPTYPVVPALILGNLLLILFLLYLYRRPQRVPGCLLFTSIIGYGLLRLMVNFWQPYEPFWFGLTVTQVSSGLAVLLSAGLLLFQFLRTRPAQR